MFDEYLFDANNSNDGFDIGMNQLTVDDDGPDLHNCVGAMSKLNVIKDIAANWNIELTDRKYTKQLNEDIDDFSMEATLKLTRFEVSMGEGC